ncbi:bifunctional DNA primase/polymerase [Mycobacterium sp. C31M]
MNTIPSPTDNGGEEHGDSAPNSDESRCVSIPDVNGLSPHKAALAYADGGAYLLPVDPRKPKNPGSIVGLEWQIKSTRDVDVIKARWDCDRPPLIAVHTGRSGVVAFDFDVDGPIPDELSWLKTGRVQLSRPGEAGNERGIYVFASAETFVAGQFRLNDSTQVGEIRSGNSVFMVQPSTHAKASVGAEYKWVSHGPVPALPEVARNYLRKLSARAWSADGSVVADSAAVAAFKAETESANVRPRALDNLTASLSKKTAGTRDCLRNYLRIAANEARLNLYPYARASAELKAAAIASYALRARNGEVGAEFDSHIGGHDFARLEANGVGWTLSRSADDIRAEVNRKYGTNSNDTESVGHVNFRIESVGEQQKSNATTYADPADSIRSDLADFWGSSEHLQWLQQWARARCVSPTAMLGASLARVVSAIPPNVVLPPTVGSYASLNQNYALVGKSGRTKSTSISAMKDWLSVEPNYLPRKPGTTEGLRKCYAQIGRVIQPGTGVAGIPTKYEFVQQGKQWSVLAIVPEVDSLIAAKMRSASLMSELRSAWSGEDLAEDFAAEDKTIILRANRYRFAMILGVQPGRARPLFDEADGGTPQRFIWLPTIDPDMPDVAPDLPPKLDLPRWPGMFQQGIVDPDISVNKDLGNEADSSEFVTLGIPNSVSDLILQTMREINRGNSSVDPLDGHKNLVQLKLAAALMALDCRYDAVTQEDWDRAGAVMAVSDATRHSVQELHRSETERVNVSRGKLEGIRASVAEETKHSRDVNRVASQIVKKLTSEDGKLSRGLVRNSIAGRDKKFFDDAENSLIESGLIKKVDSENAGPKGHVLMLLGEV